MIHTLFNRAACAALRAGIRAISPDESVCVPQDLVQQKLGLDRATPIPLDINTQQDLKNTLEWALRFNSERRRATLDLYGPNANQPTINQYYHFELPPAVIRSEYKSLRTKLNAVAVLLRPRIQYDDYDRYSENEILSTGIFGMVGYNLPDGNFAVTRLVLPEFNSTRQFVCPHRVLANRGEIIHAALDYASITTEQIIAGKPVTAYQNLHDAGLRFNKNSFHLQPGGS